MEISELKTKMDASAIGQEIAAMTPADATDVRVGAVRIARGAVRIVSTGWTKGVYCRDQDGRSTPQGASDACTFCAVGAIRRAAGNPAVTPLDVEWVIKALGYVVGKADVGGVFLWNDSDTTSQEDVVAALQLVAGAAELSLPA